ncbi:MULTISPECIES: phosphonate ABC transporter, permease protein PhnE [Macrococcoides]|uniref:Phosphate-import permease protein PhnE n=1 Tax=Macrococcoides canis TaxID=1855823 RepID=A0A1W7AEP9_9STAP|nr:MULTISPECIES: phosphonate ABC transporter, permease protein PhnE [Macrococcus]ARQ08067.1 Phosphate-import permease protein PhnE [Macrococcus canis]MBC9873840.1 phosphonate ABC transporter, permease protein PhnE [Macrococcus bohemicus]UJS27747.1 phosphonate ABC transporter, permease protein PhnE [Macrococcus canis]UTH11508.1 phosphonate ABC transporter, permease protein PhnE [Macrococcus canis]
MSKNYDYLKPKSSVPTIIRTVLIIIILLAIYIWAFSGMPKIEIKEKSFEILSNIWNGIIHPDTGYIYMPEGEDLLRGLLETFAIAFLGTMISAVLCIPLAFLSARNISNRFLSEVSKFFLSLIRVFPEIIMALLFIKAVGPGAFAGVLAVGIHSIGMLGKLFAEDMENLDMGPSEALMATGANKTKTLMFAVVPQILPAFLSFVLYRFEINLRSASILGLIGAGGIGTPLIFALQGRTWDRVGMILIGIIIMVIIVDTLSSAIRKRLV